MAEEEKMIRTINPIYPIEVSDKIAGSVVCQFCNVCDFYETKRPCIMGDFDQKRYALRNWCGYANVGGLKVSVCIDSVTFNNKNFPRDNRSQLIDTLKKEEESATLKAE